MGENHKHLYLIQKITELNILRKCRLIDNTCCLFPTKTNVITYELPQYGMIFSFLDVEVWSELIYLHFWGLNMSECKVHQHFDFGIGTQSLQLRQSDSPIVWSCHRDAPEALLAVEQCIADHLRMPEEQ